MKKVFISIFITLLLSVYSHASAGWSEIYSGTEISLSGIWGISSTDIFAVGSIILHYDGAAWSPMEAGTVSSLRAIWGSSGSDVFAVGLNGTVLHYDGLLWSAMESGTILPLWALWGSAGSDVFAVGDNGTIIHYDGTSWSPMECGTTAKLRGVWGSSPTDVFAVGDYNTILHYDGISWSPMAGSTPGTNNPALLAIWGSSATDVYAVGYDFEDAGSLEWPWLFPTIFHYDGSEWSGGTVRPLAPYIPWSEYTGIWGSSATNIFAVGVYLTGQDPLLGDHRGYFSSYDGTGWSLMGNDPLYYNDFDFNHLSSIWGSSPSDVYAVGSPRIYRYDGIPADQDNCPNDYNPEQTDSDADGIGDSCDFCFGNGAYDTDGDELCDADDNCTDTDDDGYGNPEYLNNTCLPDNCPNTVNPLQEDTDDDSYGDACDNCPNTPNPLQEDTYPPQGNGIGDACDCESDFDCNGSVDALDVMAFLGNFGRNQYLHPCTNENQCHGDFKCDGGVDASDVKKFLEDFGRNPYCGCHCPACEVGDWCVY